MIKKVNILVFGDSIVYGIGDSEKGGWTNRLRLKLEKRNDYYYDVYNLGIPDDSSLDVLKRFKQETEKRYYQGKLIILFQFGANDSSQTKTPYEVFEKRLETIIEYAKTFTNDIIYINIPKAIDINVEGRLGIIAEIRNEKINKYNILSRKICSNNSVEYININKVLLLEDISEDGVHPNEKGCEKISKIVYECIEERLL